MRMIDFQSIMSFFSKTPRYEEQNPHSVFTFYKDYFCATVGQIRFLLPHRNIFDFCGYWPMKYFAFKSERTKKHKISSCSMGSSIFWLLIMHYPHRRRVSCLTILKSTFKLQKPFLNKRIYELRYFKRIIMIMAMISTSLAGDSEYFCSITTINNNILLVR